MEYYYLSLASQPLYLGDTLVHDHLLDDHDRLVVKPGSEPVFTTELGEARSFETVDEAVKWRASVAMPDGLDLVVVVHSEVEDTRYL